MTTPDHISRVVAVVARELRSLSTTYAEAPGQRGLVEIAEDLERAAKLMPPSGPPGSVLGVRPDGVVAWGQPVVVERHDGTGWVAPFFRLDFPDAPKVAEPAPAEAPPSASPSDGPCSSAGAASSLVPQVGDEVLVEEETADAWVKRPWRGIVTSSFSEWGWGWVRPSEAVEWTSEPSDPSGQGVPLARGDLVTVLKRAPISDWRPTSPAPETDGRSTT